MPGSHQHSAAPGVALVGSLYGDKVGGTQGINDSNSNIQPAGLNSTLPYRPPKRRRGDNPDKLLCSSEGCKGFPLKDVPYCAGHAKSLGLKDWNQDPWPGRAAKAEKRKAKEEADREAKKAADKAYRQTDEYKQSDRYKMRVAAMAKAREAKAEKQKAEAEAHVDDR